MIPYSENKAQNNLLKQTNLPDNPTMFPKYDQDGNPMTIPMLQDLFGMTEEEMKANCLAAVRKEGFAILLVMPESLKTAEICLAAVQDNGLALEFAPDELKSVEICTAAVQNRDEAMEFVPKTLKTVVLKK